MKKPIYLIAILFFFACSPAGKLSLTNIHDLAAFQENSFIFALPRTRIRMRIIAVSHFTVPGPYNAYAEKYLGIKGAPSMSATEWELNGVYMDSFQEPDPDHYYSLQTDNPGPAISNLFKFSEAGIIIDHNEFSPYMLNRELNEDIPEPIHFTDLSVKRNLAGDDERKQKESSQVPPDLPVTKPKSGVKSIEMKAEEAANFILKIRKRRFKLLAGQYDVFPDGQALKKSIKELNELEKEYLSLFIGRIYTDTTERVFFYTPQPGQTLERNVFCRFSEDSGIQDAISLSGKPLVLELKSLEFNAALKDIQNPFTGPTFENIIYYRIPEKAFARVLYGSSNLIESEIEVFQYGVLVPVSFQMLNQGK